MCENEEKIIEIKKFKIYYNGMYNIEFEYNNEVYHFRIYLSYAMLVKLLENEGIPLDTKLMEFANSIKFEKSTLLFTIYRKNNERISFSTSDFSDEYFGYENSGHGLYLIDCSIKD